MYEPRIGSYTGFFRLVIKNERVEIVTKYFYSYTKRIPAKT